MAEHVKHANVRLSTFILLVILVAIAFGGAGYIFGLKGTGTLLPQLTANLPEPPAFAQDDDTLNSIKKWKIYENATFGFSFKYPSNWTLNDNMSDHGFVSLTTPEEKVSLGKDTDKNTSGAPTGPSLGCELARIQVTDKTSYDREFISGIESGGIYNLQNTTINGMDAKYYINPIVCEHNTWAVEKSGKVYEISVMTTNALFGGPVTSDDYLSAVNVAGTFTLN